MKICVVVPDLGSSSLPAHLIQTGGEYCRRLALFLAQNSSTRSKNSSAPDVGAHEVSLLLTSEIPSEFRQEAQASGIEILDLLQMPSPRWLQGAGALFHVRSKWIYEILKNRTFDVVCFLDREANGFVSIQAKKMGLAFSETALIVSALGPSLHAREREKGFSIPPMENSKLDYAERYACENADVLWALYPELLDWMETKKWKRPSHRRVLFTSMDPVLHMAPFEQVEGTFHNIPRQEAPPSRWPKVSVCISHFNHGKYLPQLLTSLESLDYPDYEVVVADAASKDPFSLEVFARLEKKYEGRPHWKFLRQAQTEPLGATRNFAVEQASGEYLVFMDSDNVASTEMLRIFVRCMQTSGSDALSCHISKFTGDGPPTPGNPEPTGWYFAIGPALDVGCLENIFGDANFCVRKEVFDRLGGFVDYPCNEDWEFLARLSLSGYRLDVIPECIFYYRTLPNSLLQTTNTSHNHRGMLHAYASSADREILREILLNISAPMYHQMVAVMRNGDELYSLYRQLEAENLRLRTELERFGYRLVRKVDSGLRRLPFLKALILFAIRTPWKAVKALNPRRWMHRNAEG